MTVTVADVAGWARVAPPTDPSSEHDVFSRVLAAVAERAILAFGADEDPANWTETQNQAVIEVAAEQLLAGRNTVQGVVEIEGLPLMRANTIDYALGRRLTRFGFA
jgi:hypothetical protein